MKVTFAIHYIAMQGEILHLVSCNDSKQWPMKCNVDNMWEVTITVKEPFAYRYCAKCGDAVRWEEGEAHNMLFFEGFNRLRFVDAWHEVDESRLVDNLLSDNQERPCDIDPCAPKPGYAWVRAYAPRVKPDQVLALVGSGNSLGYWDVNRALTMNCAGFPYWTAVFPLHQGERVEFKFVMKASDGGLVAWESGSNHILTGSFTTREATIVSDLVMRTEN